jgi:hypothetical protein
MRIDQVHIRPWLVIYWSHAFTLVCSQCVGSLLLSTLNLTAHVTHRRPCGLKSATCIFFLGLAEQFSRITNNAVTGLSVGELQQMMYLVWKLRAFILSFYVCLCVVITAHIISTPEGKQENTRIWWKIKLNSVFESWHSNTVTDVTAVGELMSRSSGYYSE